jgi:hypothetical protein
VARNAKQRNIVSTTMMRVVRSIVVQPRCATPVMRRWLMRGTESQRSDRIDHRPNARRAALGAAGALYSPRS